MTVVPGHLSVIGWALFGISRIIFLVVLVALVDAAVRPAGAYSVVGRGNKGVWMAILGVAAVVTFLGGGLFSILGIAALVAALVYFLDMRPKLRGIG